MNWIAEKASAASSFDFSFITPNSSTDANLPLFVNRVIDILLFVAGAAAVIYLIYSGILYITAAGNPDAAKKGQQGIFNAVIGIAIIVLAYFLASAVAKYAGQAANGQSSSFMHIRNLIG